MQCPFCGSKTRGVHHKCCNELRILNDIDKTVDTWLRLPYVERLLKPFLRPHNKRKDWP